MKNATHERVALCVPYRPTPSRAAVWDLLRPRYEALGYALSVSDSDPLAPFNVSEARNRAVETLNLDWDVAVHVDADTWIEPPALADLIAHASRTGHALYPERVVYLKADQVTPARELRHTGGGVAVLPRRVWEAVGGYDERFRGWGYEDYALSLAAEALTGSLLFVDVSITAFHNDAEQDGGLWSRRRWDHAIPKLVGDYEAARRDPAAMARIVSEARAYRECRRPRCSRPVR